MIIILILGIVVLLLGAFLCWRAARIKSATIKGTDAEIAKCREQIQKLEKEQREKISEISDLEDKINFIQNKIITLQSQEKEIQKQIQSAIENRKNNIKKAQQILKENAKYAFSEYEKTLDFFYENKENQINFDIKELQKKLLQYQNEQESAQAELNQIKSSIQAATAARLIQQEENNKWLFYSLNLTDNQLNDILELDRFKHRLNDPSLVGKIIWSAFVLKATNDLCNRILGTTKKCGIYKITNHETEQVYIGQSVNISDRWKAHIKCGLGIDAPATNKLYNKMQQYGVWIFTFELLEECPKDKLNEREKFWIDFYQSDKLGMNSTKGNKS